MLPDSQDKDVRAELIRKAHTAIILEELALEGRRELMSLISEILVQVSSGEKTPKAVEKVMKHLKGAGPINTRLEAIMRNCFKSNEVLGFLATDYEVNRRLDPKAMLRVLSRST